MADEEQEEVVALVCARRCQIKDMDFGWVDTLGLLKTVAFQPRVVKQNHGSASESLWIIKLKSGEYCKSIEEHTVVEFLQFCVNGRADKSALGNPRALESTRSLLIIHPL